MKLSGCSATALAISIPTRLQDPPKSLENPFKSTGNTIVDLGDDVFTRGKPHPMI